MFSLPVYTPRGKQRGEREKNVIAIKIVLPLLPHKHESHFDRGRSKGGNRPADHRREGFNNFWIFLKKTFVVSSLKFRVGYDIKVSKFTLNVCWIPETPFSVAGISLPSPPPLFLRRFLKGSMTTCTSAKLATLGLPHPRGEKCDFFQIYG